MNFFTMIGSVIKQFTTFFRVYTVYVNNYDKMIETLNNERKKNKEFDHFLKKYEVQATFIESYLILPIQRTPRYVLLLKDLLRNTPTDHPDFNELQKSFENMEEVLKYINEKKLDFENHYKTTKIFHSIIGSEENYDKIRKLGKPHRRLVFEGELYSSIKDDKKQKYYVICFSDLLLFTKAKGNSGEYYKYIYEMPITVQSLLYDEGDYLRLETNDKEVLLFPSELKAYESWKELIEKVIQDLVHREESRVQYDYEKRFSVHVNGKQRSNSIGHRPISLSITEANTLTKTISDGVKRIKRHYTVNPGSSKSKRSTLKKSNSKKKKSRHNLLTRQPTV